MNQPVEGADLPSRPIANVDLDGTLANYSFAMMSALERMRSPNEPLLTEADLGDGPEWLEARKEFVKNRPGFWRDLKPIDLGMRVLDLIRACGYSINILTKGPLKTMIAWQEKVEWVRRYVPEATATVTEGQQLSLAVSASARYPSATVAAARSA